MNKLVVFILLLYPLSALAEGGFRWDNTSIDLGEILVSKSPLRVPVHFTNISKDTLFIHRCVTGDGGTMIDYNSRPIPPGAKGVITFIADISYPRILNKSIFTKTNLGQEPPVAIKAMVVFPRADYDYQVKSSTHPGLAFGMADSSVEVNFQNQDKKAGVFEIYFLQQEYPEVDLLWLRKKDSTTLASHFSFCFINMYGNTGRVERSLPFVLNRRDTVWVKVAITYRGTPPDTVLLYPSYNFEGNGNVKLHYQQKCLYLYEAYSTQADLHTRKWFQEGQINCMWRRWAPSWGTADVRYFKNGRPVR